MLLSSGSRLETCRVSFLLEAGEREHCDEKVYKA